MSHATLLSASDVERPARPSRRLVSVLVLIAFFAMTMSCYVATTRSLLYHQRDEGPNAAYAIELYHGHLPTIDTHVTTDKVHYPAITSGAERQKDDSHRLIWTANHPPLYYLLGVPFVALANATHTPVLLIVGMRLVAALGYGVSVLLIGLIAFEVTPRRPAAAVLATSVAASCAVLAGAAGHISNDGVAVAFSSLTVLATLRILRLGVTRNRLGIMALAGAAAAATKAPGVITVVMCGAALLVTLMLRDRSLKGLLKAVGASVVATGVPGVVIGWFYVRNIVLYGDPTASAALLDRYQRSSIGSWWDVMTAPRFWHGWFDTIWIPFVLRGGPVHWVVDALTALALLGLALGIVARIMDHGPSVRVPRTPSVATVGLMVLIAHAIVILANLAQFRAGGGNPHERYLMVVLPLLAIVISIGMLAFVDAVPLGEVRRREEIAVAVMAALLMLFAVAMFHKFMTGPGYRAELLPGFLPAAYAILGLGWVAGAAAVVTMLVPRRTAAADASADQEDHTRVRIIEQRSGELTADVAEELVKS